MWLDARFCSENFGTQTLGKRCEWTVVPHLLQNGQSVLSGGAGGDISFEEQLVQELGCNVTIFDPSPTATKTFQEASLRTPKLKCIPLGLAANTCEVHFATPLNPEEGSFRIPIGNENTLKFQCLSPLNALKVAGYSEVALLKLDIEGFEYEFIESTLKAGIRPRQIAVEYHHFQTGVSIFKTLESINNLRIHGYKLIHKRRHDFLFIDTREKLP